jgi:thioredoxin reductase (NADPH)
LITIKNNFEKFTFKGMILMSRVVVIGKGPAGISAALYTVRAGIETIVIGKDGGALEKADKIENYYGFPEAVDAKTLISNGIEQAQKLGVKIVSDEVVGIGFKEKLNVITKESEYDADCIIIATGSSRSSPKIKGLAEFEGKGVSYCAVCDAFFYRGKDVAVIGDGEYAFHEAKELLPTSKSVTILSNGKDFSSEPPMGAKTIKTEIAALEGDTVLKKVVFKDGSELEVAGVFVAVGVASSSDLAKKIGAQTEGARIVVDENMSTGVPGVFAAGDCTGGLLQIAKAVSDGAKAGTQAVKYIRKQN